MDNVYFAVAGLGMILIGVLGMAVFAVLSLAALARFALLPRLTPMMARARTAAGSWVAPPPRRDVALARVERPRR